MRFFVLVSVCLLTSVSSLAQDLAPDKNFEKAARAESRRQGWPSYPDAYEDAFLAGARWARGVSKKLVCEDANQADVHAR